MKKYKRIGMQISGSYLSNLLVFAVNFFLIMILTRSLSVTEFGVYSLLAVTITVSSVLLDLGITQYILAKLPQKKEVSDTFFSLVLFNAVFVMAVIIVIVFTPLKDILIGFLKVDNYRSVFFTALLVIFLGTIWRFFSNYYQARKNIVFANFIFFLQQSLWAILVFAYFLIMKRIDLTTVFILWLIGSIATMLIAFWGVKNDFTRFVRIKKLNRKAVKEALIFSFPLLLFYIGAWTIDVGNRYVINFFLGSSQVALYSFIASVLGIVFALGTTVSAVFWPYLSEAWADRKRFTTMLNASIKYSLIIMIPALVGFFVMQRQIITLVSGEKYLASLQLLPILIFNPLIQLFNYIGYQIMLFKNKTKHIGIIYLLTAVFSIVMNIILVRKMGIVGAALSAILSYAVLFLIIYYNVRGHISLNLKFLGIIKIMIASAVMGAAIYFINPENALMKGITIIMGIIIYASMLFLLNVFGANEIKMMKKIMFRK